MTGPLMETAKALADKVAGLSLAVEQLDRRTNRSERITIGVVFGLLLDLILSVAVALVLANQINTNARLQGAIDREAQTRQESLCPMYGLVLGGYNPSSRTEGRDRDTYNRTFDVMRGAYEKLDCSTPIVPPRSDGVAPPR